jgi:hypothetical protein
MAQTQATTHEGSAETAKLLAGAASSAVAKVVGLKTSCSAVVTATYSGLTQCTETGLTAVAADTVSVVTVSQTNDAVQVDHVFTAGEAATVKGFAVLNNDADVCYSLCCFAADVALESGDKLTVQMKHKIAASAS